MKNKILISVAIIFSLQGGFFTPAIASNESDQDKKICEQYRERLKKYENEGVMGINPVTGKIQKMDKEQAEEVIENTKETISVFCEE